MKRTPIRKVSVKRNAQLREYSKLRLAFLQEHPYCQATILLNNLDEALVIARSGYISPTLTVPFATEVHHRNKRFGKRLNDTTHWLAVCRELHTRIENEKQWARANGLLENF
jgi:hypothetical protein